jgi:hypothetical protein
MDPIKILLFGVFLFIALFAIFYLSRRESESEKGNRISSKLNENESNCDDYREESS